MTRLWLSWAGLAVVMSVLYAGVWFVASHP